MPRKIRRGDEFPQPVGVEEATLRALLLKGSTSASRFVRREYAPIKISASCLFVDRPDIVHIVVLAGVSSGSVFTASL